MKWACVFVVSLLVAGFAASIVNAQEGLPHMQIHFSNGREEIDCPDAPPGTVVDSLYIVARNANCWMSGFEFKVSYPSAIMFLEDELICEPDIWIPPIPTSETGINMMCEYPVACFTYCVVDKVRFLWVCQNCTISNISVVIVAYPPSGLIRLFRFPDLLSIPLIGMTALICSTLPVEETSWGRIKSLYQ